MGKKYDGILGSPPPVPALATRCNKWTATRSPTLCFRDAGASRKQKRTVFKKAGSLEWADPAPITMLAVQALTLAGVPSEIRSTPVWAQALTLCTNYIQDAGGEKGSTTSKNSIAGPRRPNSLLRGNIRA